MKTKNSRQQITSVQDRFLIGPLKLGSNDFFAPTNNKYENKYNKCLTLERPSASIDAFQVFNFPYLRRISLFSAKLLDNYFFVQRLALCDF